MKIYSLGTADAELAEAIDYYNQQSEGLGYRFAAEVKRTIARIANHPQAWPRLSRRTRRCRTDRFPFGVVYQVREDAILVVAIMHLHRHPESWRSQLGPNET